MRVHLARIFYESLAATTIDEISGLMTTAAISGGAAAASAGATPHPTAGCTFVSTTLETEYGEHTSDVLCIAGWAAHWV